MDESIMEILKTVIGTFLIIVAGFAALIPLYDTLSYLSSF